MKQLLLMALFVSCFAAVLAQPGTNGKHLPVKNTGIVPPPRWSDSVRLAGTRQEQDLDNPGEHAAIASVDTVIIFSKAMKQEIKCVVIRPSGADSFPVLYLLHGYSGNYSNWIAKVPQLAAYAQQYQMLIVCPDGGFSSWYLDSPADSSSRYETYVGEEVPAFISTHYPARKGKASTAITGLSMGGHGALYLAFRHPERFGAAGSMSGGLDLTKLKGKYDIWKRVGDSTRYASRYMQNSVLGVITSGRKNPPAVIFDCGRDDGFFEMNGVVHRRMLELKIPHDYIERPGGHSWDYWSNSIKYQLLFFNDFFARQ